MPASRYKPISDYGTIGNLRTVALIGRDGAIDWCCLPHLDRPSVFGAILDTRRGGRFRVAPVGMERAEQRYLPNTNVLETIFDGEGARLTVTDLMPLWGNIDGRHGSEAPPEIHRLLHCEGGEVEVEVEWSPRFDYARAAMRVQQVPGGWLALAGDARLALGAAGSDSELQGEIVDDGYGPVLRGRLRLRGGERAVLVTRWDSAHAECGVDASLRMLRRTADCWRGWVQKDSSAHERGWADGWLPQLVRSELALKLLTHADTGAIAAAPTTSLPEEIGGARNWDYRYCWIRDASLTAQALVSLGHETEAAEFLLWAERASAAHEEEERELQIMYGLHGEIDLEEFELPHLEGYRGSRPVRIGNGAAQQLQLDIYGELLGSAYELARRGVEIEPQLRGFLRSVADRACERWDQPDYGLWEVRSEPQHFVYSKAMIWVALDRAVLLSEQHGLPGDVQRWRGTRDRVREDVLTHGYDPELGAFTRWYGSGDLDASNLLLPLYELLPFDDPRVQGTIDRTLEQLTENGFVYRYHGEDGLEGGEGAFGLCTFWMVDALALSGRLDEAWEIFDGIARRGNHLGLFPEQFDPWSGEFLGNFPQAFTHIGFVNSLTYLAHAEGKAIPDPAPIGTPQHCRTRGEEEAAEAE
ncbi:MAG: glycoside hydrolase family 15 protein [Longimicrobiaceae bacterium]